MSNSMRDAVVTCAMLAAVTIFPCPCEAQSPSDPDEARIEDLITASHILTNEGILDSFGHVSARSAKNPDHFFMPRAMHRQSTHVWRFAMTGPLSRLGA